MRQSVKAVLIISIIVVLSMSFLYAFQKNLIFLPSKLPQEYVFDFEQPFNEIFIETKDGARLNAIYFQNRNPKGVILYFHGNAGNLSRWGEIMGFFTQFNYDVLVMDYRTYGKSTGTLSEEALMSDAQLFYSYLKNDWDEDEIIIYGRSLGTSIASFVASQNNPKRLILESPFYSMIDVAKDRFPFLPVKYVLNYDFPTYEYVSKVNSPILILHGTNDSVVPFNSGKKLAEIISEDLLEFISITNGEHNNLMEFQEYRNHLAKILN